MKINKQKCKCGCGKLTSGKYNYRLKRCSLFIKSHQLVGKNHPMYGKHHSVKTKRNISEAVSGENHYMFGKHHSTKTKGILREQKLGKYNGKNNPMFGKKGKDSPNFGKHPSKETRELLSKNHVNVKGKNNPNYGVIPSLETRKKQREAKLKYISETYNNGEELFPTIGKQEKHILDTFEECFNYPIIRQHYVDGYWLDGYCPSLNLAIEVDEHYHKYQTKKDKERENYIKNKLNCEFIRIPGGD